jgi:type II secretory ATPase GspE/PulE/Tfp pilus assembly ATPase PilB-like protein
VNIRKLFTGSDAQKPTVVEAARILHMKTPSAVSPEEPHIASDVVGTRVSAAAMPSTQLEVDLIKEAGKFPGWKTVLSASNRSDALHVPEELQDHLLAVKLQNEKVVIAYDPEKFLVLQTRMVLMRTELVGANVVVDAKELAVVPEVLREIRLAAQKRATQSAGEFSSEAVAQFKDWILQAKELGATDVHMRIRGGGRGDVMVRVDGDLEHLPASRSGLTNNQVLTCIKAAYESLADRHSNSDGNFSDMETRSCIIDSQLGIPNLRLRFNSERGFYGPAAVLRLLSTSVDYKPMTFAQMGFAPSHCTLLEKAQRMESGIMIQAGIPGSGKTTAAKTFLESHPKNGVAAFFQIADPVEYLVRGVHQIGVQRSIATLSKAGIKDPYTQVVESILRMDPDIVDLGEVRDVISARAAAVTAKAGGMAMATMHTRSVMGIMNRFVDPVIGLSRSELTCDDLLGLLSYQALVARLCQGCALDYDAALQTMRSQEDQRAHIYLDFVFKTLRDDLKLDVSGLRFRNHTGCQTCRGRGTRGLTIIAEMLIPDDEWLDLSAQGRDRAAWHNYQENYSNHDLSSADMTGKSALEHAIFKALNGVIDPTGLERFGLFEKYLQKERTSVSESP